MSRQRTKRKHANHEVFVENKKIENHIDWSSFFSPKTVDDLIVHPKKIEDLKNWFHLAQKSTNRILLLIGPSGSAKLTTIKVLAKEFNYDVAEWTAKLEVDRDLLVEDGDFSYNYKKQSDVFQDFLIKTSRFNSIFSQNNRLLIVKDFPNIFMRKGNEDVFWSVLKKFKATSSSPLVFILTETNSKSLNIEYNLFPQNIRCQLEMDTINMNPISTSLMKKTLKLICATMKEQESSENKFQEPPQTAIDDICTQSQGDIRNAIMNLQIVCQQGSVIEALTNSKKVMKTGKARKAPVDKISKGVGRDEILDIFHGVGRSLHPKREDKKLTHSPENLSECFCTQPGNFIELLHSNYLKCFSSIDDVKDFTNVMSLSDIFQTEYRESEKLHALNLNLVVRGAMVCNKVPASGFRPIKGYASKRFKSFEEKCLHEYLTQSKNYNDGHKISFRDYFVDYSSYVKHLQTTKNDN